MHSGIVSEFWPFSEKFLDFGPLTHYQTFGVEMVLRVNLRPLHLLESLIDEILSNDFNKSYLRKETRISQIVSKDINQ